MLLEMSTIVTTALLAVSMWVGEREIEGGRGELLFLRVKRHEVALEVVGIQRLPPEHLIGNDWRELLQISLQSKILYIMDS